MTNAQVHHITLSIVINIGRGCKEMENNRSACGWDQLNFSHATCKGCHDALTRRSWCASNFDQDNKVGLI